MRRQNEQPFSPPLSYANAHFRSLALVPFSNHHLAKLKLKLKHKLELELELPLEQPKFKLKLEASWLPFNFGVPNSRQYNSMQCWLNSSTLTSYREEKSKAETAMGMGRKGNHWNEGNHWLGNHHKRAANH